MNDACSSAETKRQQLLLHFATYLQKLRLWLPMLILSVASS
jgi:hypothetical protein